MQPQQHIICSQLSAAEKVKRRDNNLFYRCGEKFFHGYKCTTKQFKAIAVGLMTNEDSEVPVTANTRVADSKQLANELEDMVPTEISLNAFIGRNSCSSLQLAGSIHGKTVLILIDSGSTHNFLSIAIVKELGIPLDHLESFVVQIDNGDIVFGKGICRQVVIKLKNINIQEDFYPFELGNVDAILGVKWLAYLDTVQANWKEMFIKFQVDGRWYKV